MLSIKALMIVTLQYVVQIQKTDTKVGNGEIPFIKFALILGSHNTSWILYSNVIRIPFDSFLVILARDKHSRSTLVNET